MRVLAIRKYTVHHGINRQRNNQLYEEKRGHSYIKVRKHIKNHMDQSLTNTTKRYDTSMKIQYFFRIW
jgi:hypothetical protein